jgi:hypothetical protein
VSSVTGFEKREHQKVAYVGFGFGDKYKSSKMARFVFKCNKEDYLSWDKHLYRHDVHDKNDYIFNFQAYAPSQKHYSWQKGCLQVCGCMPGHPFKALQAFPCFLAANWAEKHKLNYSTQKQNIHIVLCSSPPRSVSLPGPPSIWIFLKIF